MAGSGRFTLIQPACAHSGTDEGWQTAQPNFIKVWESALVSLRTRRITVDRDTYTVTIDWTNALKRQKRYYTTLKYIYRARESMSVDRLLLAKFPKRPSQNLIHVTTSKTKIPQLLSVAESAVYDAFLMMNFAAPGCCNFYGASIVGDTIEPNVSLSTDLFDSAAHVYRRQAWPKIGFIDLQTVIGWYKTVRHGASQIPSNPIERALFAILHISKIDISPVEVIWLFYAFESLLQTKVGENFASLVRRLCLLLGTNDEQSNIVRRKMRELYDIRNAIVHGGYEITHPMRDDGLDKRAEESVMRILNAVDYGYAFLVAAIQTTIIKGWTFPRFDEIVVGHASQK